MSMRAWLPRRLQTRVLWLLVVVVVLALLTTLGLIGISSRQQGIGNIARALHAQVVAADALLADPRRGAGRGEPAPIDPAQSEPAQSEPAQSEHALAQLRALGLEWRAQPPPVGRPGILLLARIETELQPRLPGRTLRVYGMPATLWVRGLPEAEGGPGGWIGVPALGGAQPLRRGVVLSVLAVGALLLLAAAWFARSLTRPLHALAEAAPGIVAGAPPPEIGPDAGEEVLTLHRALADAAERTAAAARDRELMLAGLSHDMRTPLARLRYALALLDETAPVAPAHAGPEREERGALYRDMEQDIGELDAMVGQFIDYVRDGRDEPEETVDLAGLLQVAASDQARQGRDWDITGPASALVRGRPLALRRAVANLLENAARHGAGPFEAEIAVADAAPGMPASGAWRLSVRDRGPGVPEPVLGRLGRPFQRADRARSGPGSGLGLAGVARVMAVHGGRLHLDNRDGGGFEAVLLLPAAAGR